ncbi:hypothetical protein APHNP_0073 [Anaplasma phagocytophilum str. ApNP]|uniref:Uncharacterized protein n=1 Tax=Anaplasma phagocytophilum str. ApNP TaxID=1359153 RepID=A0A0F3NFD4_ANAPH|nr:hypothetical protein APHNP_0073 [Anaplasma phagocytophilum str. ApNP]
MITLLPFQSNLQEKDTLTPYSSLINTHHRAKYHIAGKLRGIGTAFIKHPVKIALYALI